MKSELSKCDEFKGLYTSTCPPNYKKIFKFICAPACPSGYKDNGSSCYKPVYSNLPNVISITFNDFYINKEDEEVTSDL